MEEILNLQTLIFGLINLIILYFALKHFLYRPVRKHIDARSARYVEERAAIDADKELAVEERRENKRIAESAQRETDRMTHEKLSQAEDRARRIVEEASEQAERIIQEAQNAIDEDRRRAHAQIRDEIVSMAVLLSGKILEREVRQEDNQRIIDDFFKKVG